MRDFISNFNKKWNIFRFYFFEKNMYRLLLSTMALNGLNDNKAGMQGLDKARINSIIQQATSNSRYGVHARKRQQQLDGRAAQLRLQLAAATPAALQEAAVQAKQHIAAAEKCRDLTRCVVHVDMDAFYAAVHMRDEPRLRHVPMAVGSESMLSTSNYLARRFGVRAAMPGFIAKKLCPNLVLVPCDFAKYNEASQTVRKVLREYDLNLSAIGLDEAYLDLTDFLVARSAQPPKTFARIRYDGTCQCSLPRFPADDSVPVASTSAQNETVEESECELCKQNRRKITDAVTFGGDVASVVNEIRFRIEQETRGLTASAGIACNTLLAKICSDINKPNDQFQLASKRDEIVKFMSDLSVRKVSGIGTVTENLLNSLDVRKCGDLITKKAELMVAFNGGCQWLLAAALGVGQSMVAEKSGDDGRKSVSAEQTFAVTSDMEKLLEIVKELSNRLASNLANENLTASQITLKLKTSDFDTVTRAAPAAARPITSPDDIFFYARQILLKEHRKMQIKFEFRLIGVRACGLNSTSNLKNSNSGQLRFDEAIVEKRMDANETSAEDCASDFGDIEVIDIVSAVELEPCPVCNMRIASVKTELEMCQHVETCLSKRTVSELLKDQRDQRPENNRKVKKLNSDCKRPPVKCRKLDSYFVRS